MQVVVILPNASIVALASGIGIPTIPRGLSMPDGHLIVYLFC